MNPLMKKVLFDALRTHNEDLSAEYRRLSKRIDDGNKTPMGDEVILKTEQDFRQVEGELKVLGELTEIFEKLGWKPE
jgi:hypothetical protein